MRVIARAMSPRPENRFARATELAAALRSVEGASAANLAPEPAMPVVGVLDFENLSGDDAVDWLGTGLAVTITADLRRLKAVQVVSRERVQQELRRLGGSGDLTALGAQMNARWLVSGSYQRSGNRIRITPRLLEPATGEVAATVKIDGAWDDIFDLQDRVVSELARALQLETKSSGPQRIAAPETLRVEAYEQYAQGRKSFFMLGKDSLEQARRHFERAIELDPSYAMAYFALGQTFAMRWIHRTDPDDLSRASGFLQRALELGYPGSAQVPREFGTQVLTTSGYPDFRCPPLPGTSCVLSESDSNKVVFSSFDPMNGNKREFVSVEAEGPSFWDISPDGSKIAWGEMGGNNRIRILGKTADESREVPITGFRVIASVGWSADGTSLFLSGTAPEGGAILRHIFIDGRSQLLYQADAWLERPMPSPDGRYLAFGEATSTNNVWTITNFERR